MFLKKSLALGVIAAVGSSPALAVFNIDAATGSLNSSVALESLDSNGGQAVGLVTYPKVVNNTNNLDYVVKTGVAIPIGVTRYMRFDMTNAVFTVAATGTGSTAIANNIITLVAGGQAGTGFAVFSSKSSGIALVATETLTVTAPTAIALVPTMASGDTATIKFRVYEDLTKATNPATSLALYTKSAGTAYVSTVTGLRTTVTPATSANVAEVATDFKKFTSASVSTTLAKLGQATVTVAVAAALDAGTGLATALGGMINAGTSTATISGDFSITTQTYGMGIANCSGALTNLTINAAKTAASAITVTNLNLKPALCLTIGATNTVAIPKGNFTVAINNITAATTVLNQPVDIAAGTVLGSVAHNGTTVQLPYLTTFASYNQRLYIVNRGTTAATYSMTFQPETGTTAVAGTAATGSVPAGGTLAVKASDIVTLTGKTRTAASISVVAASTNVSVMTQQVNLSDGGTDTVRY